MYVEGVVGTIFLFFTFFFFPFGNILIKTALKLHGLKGTTTGANNLNTV